MKPLKWLWRSEPAASTARCGTCRHFEGDPWQIEAALPGLTSLSSASASVRGDDGLCSVHQRFTSRRSVCPVFNSAGAEITG